MCRPLTFYSSLPFLGLAAACGGGASPNATLADLPGLRLVLSMTELEDDADGDDSRPTDVNVSLRYDLDAFMNAHGGDCAVVDSVEGTCNGLELSLLPGGPDDFDCSEPRLQARVELPVADSSTVTIQDRTLTATATYGAVLAPRIATLQSATEWRFAAGETAVVAWSHPEDFVAAPTELVSFETTRHVSPNFFVAPSTFVDDEIHFTIPSPAPVDGDGQLRFLFRIAEGAATTCTGATACMYYSAIAYRHAVEIDG